MSIYAENAIMLHGFRLNISFAKKYVKNCITESYHLNFQQAAFRMPTAHRQMSINQSYSQNRQAIASFIQLITTCSTFYSLIILKY